MTNVAAKQTSPRVVQFCRDNIAELKKVVWLNRREAAYLTFLVLVVSAMVGILLGVLDFAFARLVDGLLLGG
ncbi:MAG: preprotein translocase subunit SecE [Chloroflexota bacterium]